MDPLNFGHIDASMPGWPCQFPSYDLPDQDLQFISKSVFSLPGLLELVVKVSNQGADSLARLKGTLSKYHMLNFTILANDIRYNKVY